MNSSTERAPWSPSVRCRTATASSATSRSPVTSIYGDLPQLRLPDLIPHFLLSGVYLDPQSRVTQTGRDRLGIVAVPVGDRHGDRLHRCQPERKCAAIVLDEEGDEPLEAPEDRPVNDDWAVFGVVGADVLELKPLRQLVVELDRGALPVAADGVDDVKVDLGAVEVALALGDDIGLAGRVERLPELGLGLVPGLGLAQERLRPGRQLH